MNNHIKKKDQICPTFGKEFFDLDTFKCHMNRHDNRPFPFEICRKAFLISRDMKTHMKVHSLPYKCHLCEESFSAKDLLDDHIRKDQRKSEVGLNDGVGDVKCYDLKQKKIRKHYKTIPCDQCDKKFASEYLLNNHIKNVHIKKKNQIGPTYGGE